MTGSKARKKKEMEKKAAAVWWLEKVRARSSEVCVRAKSRGFISSQVHWTWPFGVFIITIVISTFKTTRKVILSPAARVVTGNICLLAGKNLFLQLVIRFWGQVHTSKLFQSKLIICF